tara:strand:- start:2314 stop:2823 length:510 start_codon:yes stop_codon:yes gene_type:complete
MDQNSENKLDFKDKIKNFYLSNKFKIYLLIISFSVVIIFLILLKFYNEKQNSIVAEKYVQAGISLTLENKEAAKLLLEEIIISENNFYSILALNTLIEKNLVTDNAKILKFFEILENSISTKEKKDLIKLKKALFLIKNSDFQNGHNLLKILIKENSNLKSIAQEILEK